MYRIPKTNNDLRLKWINHIQRWRPNWSPNKWSYVCSLHFKPEDFDRTGLYNVRLRDGVAPSVFQAPAPSVSRTRRQPTTRTNYSIQQPTAIKGNFCSACYDTVPVILCLSATTDPGLNQYQVMTQKMKELSNCYHVTECHFYARRTKCKAHISYRNSARPLVCLLQPGTDSSPHEIETPGFHRMVVCSV